jgi:quercetin dioxygenase-like cupin family protein
VIPVVNFNTISLGELHSKNDPVVRWTGAYLTWGGHASEKTASVYFALVPGARLGKHWDTAEETQLIVSGSGKLLLDDGPMDVKAGDVFVLPEGMYHDLLNDGTEDLRVVAFFSNPSVEQRWVEVMEPVDSDVSGSPNAVKATA